MSSISSKGMGYSSYSYIYNSSGSTTTKSSGSSTSKSSTSPSVSNIKPNVSSYSGSSTIKQTINNNVSTYNKNGQVTTNGSSTSKVNVVSTGVVQNNKSNGSKTTVAVSTASSTPITYNRNGSITTSSSTAKINTTVNWTSGSTTTKQVVISNGSRTPNYSASSTPIINNRNGSYTPESASSIKLGGSTTPKVQYNNSNNAQSKKEEATVLSVGWNFSKGVVEGVGNGVKDVLNLGKNIVLHPIKTTEEFVEGVSYVAKHPIKTKDAVVEAVNKGYEDFKKADANEKANMIGKITGDVLLSAIGSKGIDKAADLAKGTKVVSKFSEAVSNVSDVVKYKVTKIVPKPTPAVAILGGGSIRVAANEIDDVARKGIVFAEKGEDVVSGAGNVGSRGADFYVAPNGKILPGQYKEWIGTNMRETLINSLDNPILKKAISELYRPGSIIGDGGTADIIRFEQETGILLSKSGHIQKAVDMSKYLQKLVDSGTLSAKDVKVAQSIINDLNATLGGK